MCEEYAGAQVPKPLSAKLSSENDEYVLTFLN